MLIKSEAITLQHHILGEINMMNKEEYKKEIVRMWDSLRDDKYKGSCDCDGVPCCEECAFYQNAVNCDAVNCGVSTNEFEMIEAVEKWSKEHKEEK